MNGVPCFQEKMDEFINKHTLPDCFAYLHNVTICVNNLEEHNNLNLFLEAANLTFNKDNKHLLDYCISHGLLHSDFECFCLLLVLPVTSIVSLKL